MQQQKRQNIIIYDHPESKIRFLEQTLTDKDWRATIVLPRDADALQEISKALIQRGYVVKPSTNDMGEATLEIHHIGSDTPPTELLRDSGFFHGMAHAVANPATTLQAPLHYGKKGYDWTIGALHDPARANGIINVVAEGFLTAAGATAKTGKSTDIKNALQTFSGFNFLSQSLTYLLFAKNNENRALGIIKNKLKKTTMAGGDVTDLHYDPTQDTEKDDFVNRVSRFMRRYPVTIGAMLNNIGMVAYMGHAYFERKYHMGVLAAPPHNAEAVKAARNYIGTGAKGFRHWIKTGFGKDIFGASLSLAGWSVLMVPPTKAVPESERTTERSAIGKAWDWMREHTPLEAGLLTLGASSFRLMGATSKGNFTQRTGERIYIFGDFALMFTNSHEYGGDAKLNQEKLSTQIVDHVGKLPVLMGAKEQVKFVDNIMQFWLDKYRADAAKAGKDPKTYHAWVERSAAEVKQEVMRKVRHQQTARIEHLGECLAKMVAQFPAAQRDSLSDKLTQTLAAMPWMKATPEEIKATMAESLTKLRHNTEAAMNTHALTENASIISRIVPNIDTAHVASALYDTLAPFMVTTEKTLSPAIATRPGNVVHNVAHQAQTVNTPRHSEQKLA